MRGNSAVGIMLLISVILFGFCTCDDLHFIPFGSPLARSYARRMHPFHPVHPDYIKPFVIARTEEPKPITQKAVRQVLQMKTQEAHTSQNRFFESHEFWNVDDKPVLANGHVGFKPYSYSIHMNGLYNGDKDNSYRARIPNYANIQFEPCTRQSVTADDKTCLYALDVHDAVFRTRAFLQNGTFTVDQIQYAHRYFETVVVNRFRLYRNQHDDSKSGEQQQFSLRCKNFTDI